MANFYSENLDLIFLLKIEQIFIWKNADQIFIKNMVDFYLEKSRSGFSLKKEDIFIWKNANLVFL